MEQRSQSWLSEVLRAEGSVSDPETVGLTEPRSNRTLGQLVDKESEDKVQTDCCWLAYLHTRYWFGFWIVLELTDSGVERLDGTVMEDLVDI